MRIAVTFNIEVPDGIGTGEQAMYVIESALLGCTIGTKDEPWDSNPFVDLIDIPSDNIDDVDGRW